LLSAPAPSPTVSPTPSPTPAPATGLIGIDFGSRIAAGWNSGSNLLGGAPVALRDSAGVLKSIALSSISPFNGVNPDGTTAPAAALAAPADATSDSFYGNDVAWGRGIYPQAVFELSGLDPARSYSFEFFASRMSGDGANRETLYSASGATSGSATLNATNNTSLSATVPSVRPTASGTIRITVRKGAGNTSPYGFFYLGNLRIRY
jgi:hypothetical protein